MNTAADIRQHIKPLQLEDTAPAWFLVIAALTELVLNRLFTALGVYLNVGESGVLSHLSSAGYFAMNAVAVMALIIACIVLPKLAADSRLAPLPARIFLMLSSSLYLPVVCVAVFKPISTELIHLTYLVSVAAIVYTAVLFTLSPTNGSYRRLVIALALVHFSAAAEMLLNATQQALAQEAHLFAEGLFVITPIFAFVFLFKNNLVPFLKRPHLPGLLFAVIVTTVAAAVAYLTSTSAPLVFILTGVRTLGITFAIPGEPVVYLFSLFVGAWVIGSLILPSKRWPPSSVHRRVGVGLTAIWTAGIQPVHPYQSILLVTGFLLLVRGLLDTEHAANHAQVITD